MSDKRRVVCWQGWRLEIPRRWDPIKLEGDYSQGHALLADTLRPRLGLRWETLNRKADPAREVQFAMKAEVGQLAAAEAGTHDSVDINWLSPLLYIEPDPPGRDIFSAVSEVSGRLLHVAYHAHRREHILAAGILPSLADLPADRATPWSIFDLNCVIPGGMKLKSHRLNAGDLGLTFEDRFNQVTVRQIAVAKLALQRQPLDAWIAEQQKDSARHYRPTGSFNNTMLTIGNRELPGRRTVATLRRRYFFLLNQRRTCFTMAVHDVDRDRLIILHGTEESLLRAICTTVAVL